MFHSEGLSMERTFVWKLSLLFFLILCFFPCPVHPAIPATDRLSLSQQERSWLIKHDRNIRVGITVIPPQVLSESGNYKGLSLDYIHLMERKLGCRFRLIAFPTWNDVMQAAKDRKIDMIFAAQQTQARLRYLLFTEPYITLPNVIIVRRDKTGGSDLKEMKGWRVTTSRGSAVYEYLQANFPSLYLVPVPVEMKGLEMVSLGEADAMVVEISRASYYIEKKVILNLGGAGDAHLLYQLRFAVRNDWPEFRTILDKGLAAVTDQERRDINRKWVAISQASVFASKMFMTILAVGTGIIAFLIAITFIWNRTLRRKILESTSQLRQELAERKRTEQELLVKEREYRTLLENVPDFIVRYDMDLRRIYVNPAWERASGLSAEEVVGVSYTDIPKIPNPVNLDYVTKLRLALETGTHQVSEFIWENAYGKELFLEYVILPEFDENDKISGVLAVGHDITERKQIEQERLNHLQFLENLDKVNRAIQGAKDLEKMMRDLLKVVLSIFDCDRAFLLHPCDPEAQMWSIPMECTKLEYPGVLAMGGKIPMGSEVGQTLRVLLSTDSPVEFGPDMEHAVPEVASHQFQVKSFLSMAIYPKTGNPWQFGIHQCSHVRRWTQNETRLFEAIGRRLADGLTVLLSYRELQESREFLDNIVESLPNMLFVKDAKSLNYVRFNRAGEELLGYRREEILGHNAYDFFPSELADFFTDKDRKVLESKHPVDIPEEKIQLKNGEERILHTRKTPIFDKDGEPLYLLGISEDITEQKLAEERMLRSEQRFRLHREQSFLGFLEWDENFHAVEWNSACERIFGYTRQEAIGRHAKDLILPQEVQDLVDGIYHNLMNQTGGRHSINKNITKDGRTIICEWFNTTLINKEGKAIGVASVCNDITERIQMEDALRNSEKDLREAQRLGRLGSWDWDATTDTIIWSQAYYEIYGFDPAKPPPGYHEHLKAYTPESAAMLDAAVQKNLKTGEPYMLDLQLADSDGLPRWITARSETKHDKDGKVVGLRGTAQDITERKATEAQMIRSERKNAIINKIAGIFLSVSDTEMYREVLTIVLDVSVSKYGIFGYIDDKGDLVIPSLTGEIWDQCRVQEKSAVFPARTWGESVWGRAIKEKKPFISDGPFHIPKGHIAITHFLTAPIVFGNKTIGLISVANNEKGYEPDDLELLHAITNFISPILNARLQRDIQERSRRKAMETIKEKEAFIRNILDSVDEGFIVITPEYRIVSSNKAFSKMMALSEDQIIGKTCYEIAHQNQGPCWNMGLECPVKQTFETRRMHSAMHFHKDSSGMETVAELKSFPITDEKGRILSVIETINDITEKRKLEEQFHQAQKLESVGRLAGGVAHDFNNMMGVILGYTEMSLELAEPDQPLHKNLQEILRVSERSVNLIRQLLIFARKQTISPKIIDMNRSIEEMYKMLKRLIGEDINLEFLPGDNLWPVKMDPSQLDQILANLCVNSRDAISGTGKIGIETKCVTFDNSYCDRHVECMPGDFVILEVSDTGCGMDKMTLEKIFEPFFTTKRKDKGTGLGMATVYGIVKQNDGFINIYSEPGHGTTVKIYIPRHLGEEVDTRRENEKKIPFGNNETILIVEDEIANLDLTKAMLDGIGYVTLTSPSPQNAIILAEKTKENLSLLITDVVMPEMNGKELAKIVQTVCPGIKTLFMSGYPSDIVAHKGIVEEGVNFIQKPFSIKDLALKVREVLTTDETVSIR